MDPVVMEWGGQLLRWLHVITAIAWIGASFFFMHLDASLKPSPDVPPGKGGEAWQVHGGGFYRMTKYLVAPDHLPPELTWHKWQAYWTWISGFVLLVWVYYAQASLYLVDPAVRDLSPVTAAGLGIGALVLGWVVYDAICRSRFGRNELVLGLLVFAFVVAASFGFSRVFSGRGALIHTGALIATIMSANVMMIIIPNQRKVIAALKAGQAPDPALGKQGKQRSVHNNYLTLPVVFLMLSNHYPLTHGNTWLPVLVALILIAGGIIRHFYNVRHADHARSPWWCWAVAAACLVAAALLTRATAPGLYLGTLDDGRKLASAAQPAALATTAHEIIVGRCSMCHGAMPVWDGIAIAPKGVRLDEPGLIDRQAAAIRLHAVLTHAMPPGNVTEMTLDERRQVAAWLETR